MQIWSFPLAMIELLSGPQHSHMTGPYRSWASTHRNLQRLVICSKTTWMSVEPQSSLNRSCRHLMTLRSVLSLVNPGYLSLFQGTMILMRRVRQRPMVKWHWKMISFVWMISLWPSMISLQPLVTDSSQMASIWVCSSHLVCLLQRAQDRQAGFTRPNRWSRKKLALFWNTLALTTNQET